MTPALCHYSLHRSVAEGMTVADFCAWAAGRGVAAIDLHERLVGKDATAEGLRRAADGAGLEISCFSLSTDFGVSRSGESGESGKLEAELARARSNLVRAQAMGVTSVRIFGGKRPEGDDAAGALDRIAKTVEELLREAEARGVVLCIENHGGLPGRSDEVLGLVNRFDSAHLRSCCDIGNFMSVGEDPVAAARAVAPVAGYVHVKDMRRAEDGKLQATTLGEGDVDVPACLAALRDAGYAGHVALEFEGRVGSAEDEKAEAEKSWRYLVRTLAELG